MVLLRTDLSAEDVKYTDRWKYDVFGPRSPCNDTYRPSRVTDLRGGFWNHDLNRILGWRINSQNILTVFRLFGESVRLALRSECQLPHFPAREKKNPPLTHLSFCCAQRAFSASALTSRPRAPIRTRIACERGESSLELRMCSCPHPRYK